MSKLVSLSDVYLGCIFSFLNFAERYAVKFSCKYFSSWLRRPTLPCVAPKHNNNDFRIEFEKYVQDYCENSTQFVDNMPKFKCSAFGGAIPQCLFMEKWKNSDLDIITINANSSFTRHDECYEKKYVHPFLTSLDQLWLEDDNKNKNEDKIKNEDKSENDNDDSYLNDSYLDEEESPEMISIKKRIYRGYHTHEDQKFNPYAHETLGTVYNMFPLYTQKYTKNPKAAKDGNFDKNKIKVVDFSILFGHKSIIEFMDQYSAFDFCQCIYDGKQLRVKNWDSIWTRSCSLNVGNLRFLDGEALGYIPNTLEKILIRNHGRRAKYENRGFKIEIRDEELIMQNFICSYGRSIVDVDKSGGVPPWPKHVHDRGSCNKSNPYFVSRSPTTGSLYLSPYANFPWYVKTIESATSDVWTTPRYTNTAFPMDGMILWKKSDK